MELTDEQKKRLADFASRKQEKIKAKEQTGWSKRIADAASETAEDVFVALDQGANAATFGLSGQLNRHGGAIGEYLRGGGSKTYDELLAQVDAERKARRDANPISSFVGTVGGSMLPTGGAAAAVGGGALRRIGAAGALGAAQNVGIDVGNAELDTLADVGQSAALGGVGGVLGQTIGEVVSPAIRGARGRLTDEGILQTAKREVGKSLFDAKAGQGSLRAGLYGDAPMTEADILADLAQRQDFMRQTGRGLWETDQAALKTMEGLTSSPATSGLTKEVGDIAARRVGEVDDNIIGTLMDNLTDSSRNISGVDAMVDARGRKSAASSAFAGIFDTPEAASVPIMSKAQFAKQAEFITDAAGNPVFDKANATSSTRKVLDRFKQEVAIQNAGPKGRGVTLKGMQNIKGELDRLIRSSLRSQDTSVEGLATRDLVHLKKYVNDMIGQVDPRYAKAAADFGDAAAYDDLTDLGRQYIKGGISPMKADDMADYIGRMAPGERAAFQDGSLDALAGKLEQSPNYLKNLARNSAEHKKIQIIFGDAIASNDTSLDELTTMVKESVAARQTYENIARNVANVPKNAAKPPLDNTGSIADIAAIVTKGGSGHFNSSTIPNAMRRILTSHPEKTQQVMVDLMRQQTPEGVQTLIDEILALRRIPNASMRWGSGASGLAAGLSTILD